MREILGTKSPFQNVAALQAGPISVKAVRGRPFSPPRLTNCTSPVASLGL